jgi:Holliday junction resolvasome RuvABC ATP-dependent DNA helicase subunit
MEHKYNDCIGTDFIGQTDLRREINFLLDGFKETRFLDNLLFVAQRGDGKTLICRKIGQALNKKFLEINGSSLKSITAFVDQIVVPHVSNNQEVTLFIDEVASVNFKVLDWLLSVLQYDPATKCSVATHDGITHSFNFKFLTVLTATTNPEKLSAALKSRFRKIEFQPYKKEELTQILLKYSDGVKFAPNIQDYIISVSRESPRHISLRLAEDVKKYLSTKESSKDTFDSSDWYNLRDTLSIKPLGLTPNEVKLLKILKEAPCTATCLTGKFNLDMGTLRREVELYPLSKSLITINQKRQITPKGLEVLGYIEGIEKRSEA